MNTNRKLGYIRVSTKDQNVNTQRDALLRAGVAAEDIFIDHGVSGAKMARPELKRMVDYIRAGDTVVVYKLDRVARSLQGLLEFMKMLEDKSVRFESISESGINTSGPLGNFVTQILGAAAEFELSLIQSRVKEGVKNALDRGVKFGRKPKITTAMREDIIRRFKEGMSRRAIAADYGISAMTVGRIINAEKLRYMQDVGTTS